MGGYTSNNKKIALNTLYMYLRMLIVMCISLYTSRVILQILGVDDFGIYNVVGGVVVLFTFINQAMATSTQRYFSYELGKKDRGDISKIYSITLRIHIWIALIILCLAETVGLWFINYKMNFPAGSMEEVNWVYQFSIIACLFQIIRAPYTGMVLSYEKMGFIAFSSIVESIMKLVIVFMLIVCPFDKLIFYAFLTMIVTIGTTIWYMVFCHQKFENVRYSTDSYGKETKEIVHFSGWATFGSIANVGYNQGVNMVLNIVYGVVTNAAMAIANQINSAILQFVGGFQQALNPQLIMSESGHDRERQETLIFQSSKLSFFIMLIFATPVIINMPKILGLWLGKYPYETIAFAQLIIIGALIECLSGPLWVTIFATGKIRTYQIVISSLLLLNVPVTYLFAKLGYEAYVAFIVRDVIFIFCLISRIVFLKLLINLNWIKFSKKVVCPATMVLLCIVLFSWLWINKIGYSSNFVSLLWQSGSIVLVCTAIIYFVGLSNAEKCYIRKAILTKIKSNT